MFDNTDPRKPAQIKAAQLRALASLGTSTDKLRQVAHTLGTLGNDHDAQAMYVMADRIERAFEAIEIPALNLKL